MLDTEQPPVYGTGFTESGKIFPVKFPVRILYTGVQVDDGQLVRRQASRQTKNKFSRNLREFLFKFITQLSNCRHFKTD